MMTREFTSLKGTPASTWFRWPIYKPKSSEVRPKLFINASLMKLRNMSFTLMIKANWWCQNWTMKLQIVLFSAKKQWMLGIWLCRLIDNSFLFKILTKRCIYLIFKARKSFLKRISPTKSHILFGNPKKITSL